MEGLKLWGVLLRGFGGWSGQVVEELKLWGAPAGGRGGGSGEGEGKGAGLL